MASINTANLLRLADKEVDTLVQSYGGLPVDVKDAIIKKQKEARQATVDGAAQEIVNLKQLKDAFLLTNAQRIQALNNEVAAIQSQLSVVQRADQYGDATSNYLPLARELHQGTPTGAKAELITVPKGWEAPAAAAATTAAAA